MAPVWAIASRKVSKTLQARQVPLLAIGAAFSFVIMMFNVPIPGGTTGHAAGAALVAVLLGPWAACIAVSVALVIQALLFGDGGITAIGANCFNMAFVMPFAGYAAYRLISGKSAPASSRRMIAAGIAGYIGLVAASLCAGIEFGVQPLLHHTASGQPLYCPYGLRVALTTMVGEHALIFGWIEAIITALVVKYVQKQEPSLLLSMGEFFRLKNSAKLWIGVGVLAILSPIGLILPDAFKSGPAWGEWGADEVRRMIGYVPRGMEIFSRLWSAAIPDYGASGRAHHLLTYGVSAILGIALCAAGAFLLGKWLSGKAPKKNAGHFMERTVLGAISLLKEAVSNDEIASRKGFLQACDPRFKCLSVALMLTAALLAESPFALLGIYGVCLVTAGISAINPAFFLKRTILFIPLFSLFIVIPAIFNFITPGEAIVSRVMAGHAIAITRQGMDSAIMLLLRVLSSVSCAVLFVLTTRHHTLLKVLRIFGVPRLFVMTMGMAYRYIYLLLDIVHNTFVAIKSRAGHVTSSKTGRRIVATNMAGLWLRSYRMQTQVYSAMLSRGYTGEPRTLDEFRCHLIDGAIVVAALITLTGALWLNQYSH